VLRAEFDPWLAEQAEGEGAVLASGVRVDELHMVDGKVSGVQADEDVLESDCVLLCDGVNSLLAQKAGLKKELTPHQVAVGFKEIIELPAQVIEDRFNLSSGAKARPACLRECSKGLIGGGFVYTNKASLSRGPGAERQRGHNRTIITSAIFWRTLKQHPAVLPLLEGGTKPWNTRPIWCPRPA
jgi:electron transfer flavoprotein-quinone oxidoreductase